MTTRFPHAIRFPVCIFFFACIFFFFLFPVGGDGDFFHHLNAGTYIIQTHQLPRVDQYTFTASGKSWIDYAWGTDVLLSVLYHTVGPVGINIIVGLLAVLTFFLLFLYFKALHVSTPAALLTLGIIAPVLAIRWPPRPELFTYPFCITILLTYQIHKKSPRMILLMPIIILLWANMYGSSVILGLAFIGFSIIRQLIIDYRQKKLTQLLLYISGFLSFPISCINGYGYRAVLYLFLIPRISHNQTEWAGMLKSLQGPVDFVMSYQYWLLLYILYAAFFVLVVLLSIQKIKQYKLLSVLSLSLFMPFFIFRHVPTAVILSAPLLAVCLSAQTGILKRVLLITGIVMLLVTVPISLWTDTRGVGQDTDPYSPTIITFLQKNRISGRAFHNQQIGAYLSYHLYPDILVFNDTRDDLFIGTQVMNDFSYTFAAGKSVLPLLSKYNIDVVIGDLADGVSYQPLFYSDDWAVVFIDGTYFIAVPVRVASAKQLSRLDAIDPFTVSGAKTNKESEALDQYLLSLSPDTDLYNNTMRYALIYFSMQKYDKTIEKLQTIHVTQNPKTPLFLADIYYLFTQSYFALGDCAATKTYLDKTLSQTKGKFIFTPRRTIPSPVHKGYTFYYLLCKKNLEEAQRALDTYTRDPSVSGPEKTETTAQFNKLIQKK
jgi:tetratricopeptide (TPR) repeat protein